MSPESALLRNTEALREPRSVVLRRKNGIFRIIRGSRILFNLDNSLERLHDSDSNRDETPT